MGCNGMVTSYFSQQDTSHVQSLWKTFSVNARQHVANRSARQLHAHGTGTMPNASTDA
jgi:hypothetical protein